jgi:CheY-like chemotaxis protein
MGSDETATSILAVDDNPENLRLLSSMLGGYGFDLRLVTSGRQALAATESDPPDLVLLDINMPEMNGYEVCEHLKALPAAADVPVIFLTALGDAADGKFFCGAKFQDRSSQVSATWTFWNKKFLRSLKRVKAERRWIR